MFDAILIANRGEIAVRIAATARRMGLRTVAVYSDADRTACHVGAADEARYLGPSPAEESYLRGDRLIEVAREAGAGAIHPGYGFLSENAEFAEACAAAGLVFVGPGPAAIRAMGSKTEAKRLMADAGVPVLPGYHDDNLDLKVLTTAARKIGYPVMIKATAGGGGRGMRIITRELDLAQATASARREALAGFGDDRVLMEKYLAHCRHIEVQVAGDRHGNVVHLFERECSLQRRHQKVVEEAPASGLADEVRQYLGEISVVAAKTIDYLGVGTVEFVVDREQRPYFIEMNTRLQVEHPVTEMITGIDLVEWQLRVAAGEPLPLAQDEIQVHGHAIEARLCAEDPERGFLPAAGDIVHLRLPHTGSRVRVDSGFNQGDTVPVYYDSLLAKIIAWGNDRTDALAGLRVALDDTELVGVHNNLAFLRNLVARDEFAAGDIDTAFIEGNLDALVQPRAPASDTTLALACLYWLLDRARGAAQPITDPTSPWGLTNCWRLNDAPREFLWFIDGDDEVSIPVLHGPDGFVFGLSEGDIPVSGSLAEDGRISAYIGGLHVAATVVRQSGVLTVIVEGSSHRLEIFDPLDAGHADEIDGGHLSAPIPGKVTHIYVEEGAEVVRGAALVVLEAMKMEHTVAAPSNGRVERINCALGEWVEEGSAVVDFQAAD